MCRQSDFRQFVFCWPGDALRYIEQLHNAINEKQEARLIWLDISSAFDRVWHKGLIAKLESIGIHGKLLSWLNDYLKDRVLEVAMNGICSDAKSVNEGVPQRSILRPLLFLVQTDIPWRCTNTTQ